MKRAASKVPTAIFDYHREDRKTAVQENYGIDRLFVTMPHYDLMNVG
jgi:hypothetical protein